MHATEETDLWDSDTVTRQFGEGDMNRTRSLFLDQLFLSPTDSPCRSQHAHIAVTEDQPLS